VGATKPIIQWCILKAVNLCLLFPAGMPAASLSNLSSSQVLQLAGQLTDPQVGLRPSSIVWLLDWANSLTAADLQQLSRDQLFELVQVMSAATSQDSSSGSNGSSGSRKVPSGQLLGMLCWALAEHVSTASAQQVYCLISALAGWQYTPPNGSVLLSTAAARVADKLPMLDQVQVSDVLCGFARLGFTVGEPLQSKLCSRLLQATVAASTGSSSIDTQQTGTTAAVLAAVLTSISSPPPELVRTLMAQLDGKLQQLPFEGLQQLGTALAAAGMSVQPAAQADTAASSSRSVSMQPEWGQQYLAAACKQLQRAPLSAQQLAAACSCLNQLGLLADEPTAEAVVTALQKQLDASSSSRAGAVSIVWLVPVVSYITDSRFKPAAPAMETIEQQLLAVLRNRDASSSPELLLRAVADSTSSEGAATMPAAAYSLQEQQQQGHAQLRAEDFVQLLKAMHDWGRRPGSDFAAAAHDWSRYQLVSCDIATLGPLLLWLSSVCGKPPAAWMVDWVAVSQPILQEATAEDLPTIAAALAVSWASASTCSPAWWDVFSTSVLQQLQEMNDEGLEVLCSNLYRLGRRPSQAWLSAVVGELQGRVPDSSLNTAAARALAWARQLKAE
jgi:hypothetical protein